MDFVGLPPAPEDSWGGGAASPKTPRDLPLPPPPPSRLGIGLREPPPSRPRRDSEGRPQFPPASPRPPPSFPHGRIFTHRRIFWFYPLDEEPFPFRGGGNLIPPAGLLRRLLRPFSLKEHLPSPAPADGFWGTPQEFFSCPAFTNSSDLPCFGLPKFVFMI